MDDDLKKFLESVMTIRHETGDVYVTIGGNKHLVSTLDFYLMFQRLNHVAGAFMVWGRYPGRSE